MHWRLFVSFFQNLDYLAFAAYSIKSPRVAAVKQQLRYSRLPNTCTISAGGVGRRGTWGGLGIDMGHLDADQALSQRPNMGCSGSNGRYFPTPVCQGRGALLTTTLG